MASSRQPLDNWSTQDKFNLLQTVNNDFENMAKEMPNKSRQEIKEAAIYIINCLADARDDDQLPGSRLTLSDWRQFLARHATDEDELADDVINPNAIRMMANFNDIPPPERMWGIDFRQVFLQMANAMEGKPVVADAHTTHMILLMTNDALQRGKGKVSAKINDFLENLEYSESPPPMPHPVYYPRPPPLIPQRAPPMAPPQPIGPPSRAPMPRPTYARPVFVPAWAPYYVGTPPPGFGGPYVQYRY